MSIHTIVLLLYPHTPVTYAPFKKFKPGARDKNNVLWSILNFFLSTENFTHGLISIFMIQEVHQYLVFAVRNPKQFVNILRAGGAVLPTRKKARTSGVIQTPPS